MAGEWAAPRILSADPAGNQENLQIASFSDGSFVAVWTDFPMAGDPVREGPDTQDGSIRGQMFSADGSRRGGEFLINTTTENFQALPTVAALSDGRFAVAWENYAPLTDDPHVTVSARIFNGDGTPYDRPGLGTGDFLVNRDTANDAHLPAITALSGGRFAISYNVVGSMYRTKAQSFNADGSYLGSEGYVKVERHEDGTNPVMVGLGDRYAVILSDGGNGYAGSASAIRGVIRTASGGVAVNEFTVSGSAEVNIAPQAVALTDGRFLVVWAAGAVGSDSFAFKGRIYTAAGAASGPELALGAVSDIRPLAGLSALPGGGFAMAYYAPRGGDSALADIHMATFDASGAAKGHDIVGQAGLPWPYDNVTPSLAALQDGDVLVGWHARNDQDGAFNVPTDVFGRLVDTKAFPPAPDLPDLPETPDLPERPEVPGAPGTPPAAGTPDPIPPIPAEAPALQRGSGLKDTLTGGADSDILMGLGGLDRLTGNGGSDILKGGLGSDVLTGGAGRDVFVFDTKPNKKTNLDKITDFSVKDDTLWLDNKYMAKLGKGSEAKPGKLDKKFFKFSHLKQDKDDYVIYGRKTGVLSYDADGSGKGKAVEIAILKKNLKMTAADFFVI